jgi:hypothetical protein
MTESRVQKALPESQRGVEEGVGKRMIDLKA